MWLLVLGKSKSERGGSLIFYSYYFLKATVVAFLLLSQMVDSKLSIVNRNLTIDNSPLTFHRITLVPYSSSSQVRFLYS